jgi:hypothetical protein
MMDDDNKARKLSLGAGMVCLAALAWGLTTERLPPAIVAAVTLVFLLLERIAGYRRLQLLALTGLGGLAWGLVAYRLLPAILGAAVLGVFLLTRMTGHRRPQALALIGLGGFALWAAFGTATGYFWLNRLRLDALIAEIQAVPGIRSMELGQDGQYVLRDGTRPGTYDRRYPLREGDRLVAYDSYRFVNDVLVTHYRDQAKPEAFQPEIFIDDLLRELNVPAARYWDLRARLQRLSLSRFSREPGGQISLGEPVPGGTPWGHNLLFSPTGEPPQRFPVYELQQFAPHWFRYLWA